MSPNSRIWIYQSATIITKEMQQSIQLAINQFCQNWHSHGKAVQGTGRIEYDRFIVLIVDEQSFVSGCSIDSSVEFMRQLEQTFGLHLFNRTLVNYFDGDELCTVELQVIRKLIEEEKITPDTLVFDHTISTLAQLQNEWIKPVKNSWLSRFIPEGIRN